MDDDGVGCGEGQSGKELGRDLLLEISVALIVTVIVKAVTGKVQEW